MRRLAGLVGAVAFLMVVTAVPVGANNASGLRWADDNPDLTLVDLGTGAGGPSGGVWTDVLGFVQGDWETPLGGAMDVLSLTPATSTTTPQISGSLCSTAWNPNVDTTFTPNEIYFCHADFGNTRWAGLSIVWVDSNDEIVVAQTLMNDFHLTGVTAADFNFRRLAACQEVGHAFGVGHQNGPNKVTCMNARFGAGDIDFISPNAHDFDQLEEIYLGGGNGGSGGGNPCPQNSNAPQCQVPAPGRLSRVIHIIPAPVPAS